jgi:site-specific DNA-methyltransferase (adenine-specific)
MDDNSIDSCVTDPPYGLSFMGKAWDYDVPKKEIWEQVFRVLKPGGHLLSFFGSRTYHRGAIQIEDAGFEIRDQIMWLYGSGFPKSHDISKAIDKNFGLKREVIGTTKGPGYTNISVEQGAQTRNVLEWEIKSDEPISKEAQEWKGWGTALKPAHEPIVVARKPIEEKNIAANVLKHGTGAINIDESRVPLSDDDPLQNPITGRDNKSINTGVSDTNWGFKSVDREGGLGRFPANIIHDGAIDIPEGRFFYCAKASKSDRDEGLEQLLAKKIVTFQTGNGASGNASSLSANRNTEYRNIHPTVKPTELMKYLVRLVTPKNGVVLDPFMGSGSTGKACGFEGFRFVGIEMSKEYFEIAKVRIDHAYKQKTATLEDFFS